MAFISNRNKEWTSHERPWVKAYHKFGGQISPLRNVYNWLESRGETKHRTMPKSCLILLASYLRMSSSCTLNKIPSLSNNSKGWWSCQKHRYIRPTIYVFLATILTHVLAFTNSFRRTSGHHPLNNIPIYSIIKFTFIFSRKNCPNFLHISSKIQFFKTFNYLD